jgi:DNA-binding XRE family transcriptional regulator
MLHGAAQLHHPVVYLLRSAQPMLWTVAEPATEMDGMGKRARDQLARKLRVLRMMRGWSQEDLAAASGLHRTSISLLERSACNISLDNLERLANAFGLTPSELLATTDAAHFGEHMLATLTKRTGRKER